MTAYSSPSGSNESYTISIINGGPWYSFERARYPTPRRGELNSL